MKENVSGCFFLNTVYIHRSSWQWGNTTAMATV